MRLPQLRPSGVRSSTLRGRGRAVAVLWRLDVDAETDAIYYNTVQGVSDTFHNMYSQKAISAWLTSLRIAHRWERADADWLLILDAGYTPG